MTWPQIIWVVSTIVIDLIARGCVLCILWDWFITPTFGLPKLSIAAGVGVILIVKFLTFKKIHNEEQTDMGNKIFVGIINTAYKAFFTLFFGYIVHLFM